MPPVVFASEVAGKEAALMVAMEEETKEAYKREKASLIGYQGSFTKKETAWGDAVEVWHADPLSPTLKETAEEFRMAMKEAKARLHAAIYKVIHSYGVVTDAYENFMDQMEKRYQLINKKFMALSASFRDNLKMEEDQKLQMIKDERAEVKKERDERIQEIEARDGIEVNRVERKTRLMELELQVVRERAALEQAARDNPAPSPAPACSPPRPSPRPSPPPPCCQSCSPTATLQGSFISSSWCFGDPTVTGRITAFPKFFPELVPDIVS